MMFVLVTVMMVIVEIIVKPSSTDARRTLTSDTGLNSHVR